MDCPFSAARLHELRWEKNWRLDQIADLAGVILETAVDLDQVRAWFAAAGIAADVTAPTLATPGLKPERCSRKKRERTWITRECALCGKLVTRYACEMEAERIYCCREHHREHVAAKAAERRFGVRALAANVDLAIQSGLTPAEKRCSVCRELKPAAEFSVARGRWDGRAHRCRVCNAAKSKAYYEANRERHIARVQARRRAHRSGPETG